MAYLEAKQLQSQGKYVEMRKMMINHHESAFLAGCAPFHDPCFVAKQADELSGRQVSNSTILGLDAGARTKFPTSVGWPAEASTTIKPAGQNRMLVFIGADKDVWEADTQTITETVGEIREAQFPLASLTAIGDVMRDGILRTVGSDEILQFDGHEWERIA